MKDDTLILVLSDNGQPEGGPLGFVNAMGLYNLEVRANAEKLAIFEEIGGPNSH